MIEPNKRQAIYCLSNEGLSIREIARRLKVSRNTVRTIIKQKGDVPDSSRGDRITIDPELLQSLYDRCNGWVERVHEILKKEKGIDIGYSTLTRLFRELGLGPHKKQRCMSFPDQPGEEMQHDTSLYLLKIGNKSIRVIGSILYFRYSKVRYLKFYRSFNRFKMKCFFHEALIFFGYTARNCIIDNTNLARLKGTGKYAVMAPEMEQFAQQYGFKFVCHEIGHANRKAGNERSFYTVETNFFPGRTFESMQDLNRQALEWATVKMAHRPVSKTHLIPAKAFEHEQSYLIKLPTYVPAPYIVNVRLTDQYGYISFDGNYYWVPGTARDDVKVLQYSDYIDIYHKRGLLARYQLPPESVKNERFSPVGKPEPPYQPKDRKRPTAVDEQKLRSIAKEVDDYLTFALKQTGDGKQKHRFIRQLYGLYQKITLPLLIKALDRSLKYRIVDIETVERIAVLEMQKGNYHIPFPSVPINQDYQERKSYREGQWSDEVDLSGYDNITGNL